MAISPPMTIPDVRDARAGILAARAVADLRRLLLLDDLWTSRVEALGSVGSASDDELAALKQLGEEVADAIDSARNSVEPIRAILNAADDAVINEGLRDVIAAHSQSGQLEEILETAITTEGEGAYEFRGAAIAGCDYVLEEAEAEKAELRAQLDRLGEGETTGDLRPPFRCAVVLALAGAGVALAVATGGGAVLIAAGVVHEVGSVIIEWDSRGCRDLWKAITRGRR
jgi:hypothetical protein